MRMLIGIIAISFILIGCTKWVHPFNAEEKFNIDSKACMDKARLAYPPKMEVKKIKKYGSPDPKKEYEDRGFCNTDIYDITYCEKGDKPKKRTDPEPYRVVDNNESKRGAYYSQCLHELGYKKIRGVAF